MAQFSVNAQRFDPYKNFKFRVKWDGKYVAGVSKVGALKRTTEVVKHRDGGDPSSSRKSPGRTEYEAITLERGVTNDVAFELKRGRVTRRGSGLRTSTVSGMAVRVLRPSTERRPRMMDGRSARSAIPDQGKGRHRRDGLGGRLGFLAAWRFKHFNPQDLTKSPVGERRGRIPGSGR